MPTLLLASGNPGKIRELRALLTHLAIDLLIPSDLGLDLKIVETGSDYASNARLKAESYAVRAGCWTLADDSGLEVEALGGAPGLHSARIAGPGGSDADRRAHLLALLAAHPRPWKAAFHCTAALASPSGPLDLGSGICSGEIVPLARGRGGFGYDPIFLVSGTGRTMAELPMEEKNRLSHRARAIEALMPVLKERLGIGG